LIVVSKIELEHDALFGELVDHPGLVRPRRLKDEKKWAEVTFRGIRLAEDHTVESSQKSREARIRAEMALESVPDI
jgi:hypothetical protein